MTGLNTSKNMAVSDMFEDRYVPEPNSGCWLWLGAPDLDGYGSFHPRRERWKAHRYSWGLHFGEIPDGMMVCHQCDVTACVNPNHLFLGTAADNAADMVRKRRQLNGSLNHSTKLTKKDVLAIREDGRSYSVIGEQYGVTAANVCAIKRRQTWRHIDE